MWGHPEYAKGTAWAFVLKAENDEMAWADHMTSLSDLGLVVPPLTLRGSARALR